MCVSPYLGIGCLGGGGGLPTGYGLVHNLLMQIFTVGSSKIEVLRSFSFDVFTTQHTIQGM